MFCVIQGVGERSVGIYVKKVVDQSAAQRDGRLEPGDQLLSVNGQSLVGISQEEYGFKYSAASKMASSGPIVSFEVCKHAARYNGLIEWLSNPPSTPSQQQSSDHFPPSNTVQPIVPAAPANIPGNSNLASVSEFSRQNSATSTASNFSSQPHFMVPFFAQFASFACVNKYYS
ncbi:unnamed protein product [Gongylonema pulchrum]|uniref:PDZ domain-containing protein n=1 Tax=Gongylonema pulchrum TaxID=637853 RepID=A0A183D4N4_9BILA|nr:unnamed protein product [Gongylonema pulchrum]